MRTPINSTSADNFCVMSVLKPSFIKYKIGHSVRAFLELISHKRISRYSRIKNNFKLLSYIIFLTPAIASAQVDLTTVVDSNKGEPINITSENLIIKNAENLSIFENNVHVIQGEMDLRANQMRVYSEVNPNTKKSNFKKIEASGNVDFKAADKTAKSDHAVYDVKAGILILTENVRLTDADTILQGRKFEYNIKTKQSKISNPGGGKPDTKNADANTTKDPTAPPTGGRSKVTFTPGEGIKTFGMPMDAFDGMRGKEKKEGAGEEKPKP